MKEEYGEGDILEFLTLQKVLCWKNTSTGFFNTKKWHFQRNKSNFVRNGVSDILWILEGKLLAIEVKTKKDYNFFNRDLETLKKEFERAHTRTLKAPTLKKYQHAIEQRAFIDDVNNAWGIGFYARDIPDVIRELKERWFYIY